MYKHQILWATSSWLAVSSTARYRQTANISHTLVGNRIVDHSDVVGASPVGSAPNYIFILNSTPGFNGLYRDNCKTRRETIKFLDLVILTLEIWQWQWLGVGGLFLRCGSPSILWAGPFIFSSTTTGDVWTIPLFEFGVMHMLHVEHISCIITNCGQHKWVIPSLWIGL